MRGAANLQTYPQMFFLKVWQTKGKQVSFLPALLSQPHTCRNCTPLGTQHMASLSCCKEDHFSELQQSPHIIQFVLGERKKNKIIAPCLHESQKRSSTDFYVTWI